MRLRFVARAWLVRCPHAAAAAAVCAEVVQLVAHRRSSTRTRRQRMAEA